MKCRSYLYFLSNTKATAEQGHCSASIFLRFCNTCSKYSRIILFADGLPNHENRESFVRKNLSAYGSWGDGDLHSITYAAYLKSSSLCLLCLYPRTQRELSNEYASSFGEQNGHLRTYHLKVSDRGRKRKNKTECCTCNTHRCTYFLTILHEYHIYNTAQHIHHSKNLWNQTTHHIQPWSRHTSSAINNKILTAY